MDFIGNSFSQARIKIRFSSLKHSNDPADYFCELITEEEREFWVREGPVFFHNEYSDFSEVFRNYKEAVGIPIKRNFKK